VPTLAATPGSPGVGAAAKGRLRRTRKLVRLLAKPPYRTALRAGVAAAVEHESVAFEHDFASIIDVGAHRGQFALLARARYPRAALYCLEPLTEARTKLEQLLENDAGATIIGVAAGRGTGEADFHVSRLTDSSSLLPITNDCVTAFPGTEESGMTRVSTARLDDIFADAPRRPCLLKVDVQGAELEVLIGAERLLDEIDEIFVECSFVEFYGGQALIDKVIDHVHARGFRLSGIYSVVRDGRGRCLQADLLFGRRPSA